MINNINYCNVYVYAAQQWILSDEPVKQSSPDLVLIEDLLVSSDYLESTTPRNWLRRATVVSPSQIRRIVELTVGQRDNPAWCLVRKYRFTASNFGSLLHAVEKNR